MDPRGPLPCLQEPYPEPHQSSPYHSHPISLRTILILTFHLWGLVVSFLMSFLPNPIYIHLCPLAATCPVHLTLLDLIVLIIFGKKLLVQFPQRFYYFIPLGSKFFPQNPFSNTVSLWSSRNIRNPVSHPCKTIGEIIVFYILIFTFLNCRLARIVRIWCPRNFSLIKFLLIFVVKYILTLLRFQRHN
jgi:hypothetical protein